MDRGLAGDLGELSHVPSRDLYFPLGPRGSPVSGEITLVYVDGYSGPRGAILVGVPLEAVELQELRVHRGVSLGR